MCSSLVYLAVYGVLELEESHFTRGLWEKKQKHMYWKWVIGEQLVCEREEGNPRDRYTVAIKKVVP